MNMVDITGLHPIDEYLSRLVNDYNITGIWVADVHAIATMADLAADLIDAGIGTGLALEDFSMKHAYYGLVENRNNIWSTEKNASTDRTMKESRIARYNAEERLYDMAFRQFNKIEKFGGEKSGKGVFEGIDKIWSEQTLPIFFSGVNHPVRIDQGTNMMDSAYNHLGQNDILLRIKFTDLIKSVKKPSFLNANKNLVYERMKSDQEHWEKAWSKEVKQGKNYWNQLKLKQLASKGFQDQLGNRFEVEVWSRTDFSLSRQQSIQNVSSANNNVSRDYRPINNYSHMHNLNENNVIAENQGTGYRYGRTIRPIPFEAFYE
ncbi:MAG: hypothetical protein GY938_22915 [Ketobacter sp.]|nr:hypothetical protein [Ketobacter sp.]